MRFDPVWRLQRSATLALILSPVGILVIAAARLLIIAGYSPATASAIVTSDGYLNALLGSVLPVIPLVLPYLALLLLFFRRFVPGALALLTAGLISPSRLSGQQALMAASADLHRVASWCSHHTWIAPVALVAAVFLVATLGQGLSSFGRTAGTMVALALTVYVATLFPLQNGGYYEGLLKLPWIPAEVVTLTSGSAEVGYVLADTNVSMEVLINSTRQIAFYPNGLIASQRICAVDPATTRQPVVRLIPVSSAVPACSSLAQATTKRQAVTPGRPPAQAAAAPVLTGPGHASPAAPRHAAGSQIR